MRGEVVDTLLDDVGELRVRAATLSHLIRGIGGRAIMGRARSFAERLSPELRREFLPCVRDARERDRRLLESEEALGGMLSRLHQSALELRVVPIDLVFNRLPRLVRDLAQHQGKSVELALEGRDVRIDKSMVDALADPLIHMVRNAVDHGIEPPAERAAAGKPERAHLTLRAEQRGAEIRIEVVDDGRVSMPMRSAPGQWRAALCRRARAAALPDAEIFPLIFEPGLSTAATVTETSGRGVGMDIVLSTVRRLNGDVTIRSERGRGTGFTLVLPVSAALQTALIVRVGDQSLAIPERHVMAVAEIETDAISLIGNHRSILHRQAVLPLYGLGRLLGMDDGTPPVGRQHEPVVVTGNGRQMIGLEVDAIEQRQELFLRDLDPRLASFPGVGGASVLGDGRIVLVLDGDELIQIAARGVEPTPEPAGRNGVVSLYLQAVVGDGRYLLEAARIVEVRPLAAMAPRRVEELPRVDLRVLFGAEGTISGYGVLVTQAGGGTAALLVDHVDGLVEIGRSEWRPLPPIGPLGQLIDAVSAKLAEGRPMLRLRGERALAAAYGRDDRGRRGSRLTLYRGSACIIERRSCGSCASRSRSSSCWRSRRLFSCGGPSPRSSPASSRRPPLLSIGR